MREVRMTFGDHLEELRRRILFCVVYLAFGVGICFVYGEQLLEWTLEPHRKAFAGAQRDRLVKRMGKTVAKLGVLTQARAGEGLSGLEKISSDEVLWELLFVHDVLVHQMSGRLAEPVNRLVESLTGKAGALDAELRAKVAEPLREFGQDFTQTLVREFAVDLELGRNGGILTRLERLDKRLEDVNEAVGPTKAQEAVGWGKNLDGVREPLKRFAEFLMQRRAQALSAEIAPIDLRRRVQGFTRLPELLDGILGSLEADVEEILRAQEPKILAISYVESFNAYLKVSLVFGVILTIPFLLYELWKFIGAGLYPKEQKYVVLFMPFSLLLFAVGAAFGYFAMIPVGLEFLAGWGIEDVTLAVTLGNYVGLFFTLTLILGLVFQTPLLMIFVVKIGVVDVATLRRMRRISIFVGVCLAVVLTPPDPFSWALMALPMVVLYEVGILCCDLMTKKQA